MAPPRPPPNAHRRSHRGRMWAATHSARNSAMYRACLSCRRCPAPLTRPPVRFAVRRASIRSRHQSGRVSGVDARLGDAWQASLWRKVRQAASLWRGAGGSHLPRFPRRGRRGRQEGAEGARWTAGCGRGASTTTLLVFRGIRAYSKVNMRPLGFRQSDGTFPKVARGDSSEVTL